MLLLVLVLGIMTSPLTASPTASDAARAALGSAATLVDYGAKEAQQQALTELEEIKAGPYQPRRLAQQFAHGINSHMPDGITTSTDSSRYVKDEQCGLVMDRVPGVTDAQFEQLRQALRQRAPSTVAYSLDQITGYTGVEPPMRIDLNTTARIFCPPRRNWSPAESTVIKQKCDELLGGLQPVCQRIATSDYACNPTLAMKRAPDGTWSDQRFCINFIPINRHTELDRYGSHQAERMFARVVKAKFLTALDLRSGFHQIPMDPDSVAKTAFWWSGGDQPPQLMAYNRMPFGLKNASAKFQRVMDAELLRAKCTEFAFAYIDDLIIASDSWEEHVGHTCKVLQMLADCNLKIHPEKSLFATDIVEYLGHNVVGQHGIAMQGGHDHSRTRPAPSGPGAGTDRAHRLVGARHWRCPRTTGQ